MRSIRLLTVAVLAVVLALSAVMPASARINLLQNPGFETGSLAPWGIDGDGWEGGVTEDGAHTGAYLVWFYAFYSEDVELWQPINPPRCAEYLEVWYRGDGEGGAGVHYSDNTDHWEYFSDAEEWTLFHIDLDTAKLVEAVDAFAYDGGEYYVDDFDLEACTAAVGGFVIPANNFAIVAPWLAIVGVVGCIGTLVVVAKKRHP
jgi:hypothetical protein